MIILSGKTALEIYLNGTGRKDWAVCSLKKRKLDKIPENYKLILSTEISEIIKTELNLEGKMYYLITDPNDRRNNSFYTTDICPKTLLRECLIFLGSKKIILAGGEEKAVSLYIVSPEIAFIQACRYLPLYQAIRLAYDLCSTYIADSNAEFGQRSRPPIADTKSISAFLENTVGTSGVKQARRAIKYVVDGSHSPMETCIAMISVMPFNLGGFSLKKPKLNLIVNLSEKGKAVFGFSECSVDVGWEEEKVAIEYDSITVHMNSETFNKDKRKSTALKLSGYLVLNMTYDNLKDVNEIEDFFLMLRSILKMKNETPKILSSRKARVQLLNDTVRMQHWIPWEI